MNQMPPGVVFHYCTLLNATIGVGGGTKQGDLLKTQLGWRFAEEKKWQVRARGALLLSSKLLSGSLAAGSRGFACSER